jgi:O-methyltransferase
MRRLLWKLHYGLPGFRLREFMRWELPRYFKPGWPHWPRVGRYSAVPPSRIRFLESLAVATDAPGVFMECGVGSGGTALLLALVAKRRGRAFWMFDTFEGLPAPTANDPDYDIAVGHTGTCRGEFGAIREMFQRYGVWDRTTAVKGLFQDTMPAVTIPPIAVLHLDGDWYDSTKTCLTYLWPQVSPGGVVQFDDYGAWQGCRKAVDEFLLSHPAPLHRIDDHGAWLQKPIRGD